MATLTGHVHPSTGDLTAELQASRMRIVEAADEARRRLERDLHDGAQQRFVSASLLVSLARRRAGDGLAPLLEQIAGELEAGLADLRDLAHGIHPTILTDRGLRAAIDGIASRSRIPVDVNGTLPLRPAPAVASALNFTVAEALTNTWPLRVFEKPRAVNELLVHAEQRGVPRMGPNGRPTQMKPRLRSGSPGRCSPAGIKVALGLVDGNVYGHGAVKDDPSAVRR